MKSFIKIIAGVIVGFVANHSYAQCNLNLTSTAIANTITCGQCVDLSAFGSGSGAVPFNEDFNSGTPTGWQFTQATTISNNTCGVPSPDGSDFMWMGDASVNPRDMATVAFDLSPGGTICFEMRFAEQADAAPCEGPDLANEGVFVEYSIDNGASWVTIQYWDPNGGYDPNMIAWNQYCVNIPAGALTTSTMIRWHQDDVSGAEYDHWGIDNVIIQLDDPTSEITWLHDGFSYGQGSSGGTNPDEVCPVVTTTYTAQLSTSTATCTQDIEVIVVNPTFNVEASLDTSICAGTCIDLLGTADVVVSPGGSKTFANVNPSSFDASLFSGDTVGLNVQGLNMNTITPGSIEQVCLTYADFVGTFPPSGVEDLAISLFCPDGSEVLLVAAGDAPAGDNNIFGADPSYYQNVCFVAAGANDITTIADNSPGAMPITGNYDSNEDFSAMNGCTANGLWSLSLNMGSLFGGNGSINGWSITFDDPAITYPGDFTWTPTANMTNSDSIVPTICPTGTTIYTLTVSDTNQCASATDSVIVTIGGCCAYDVTDVIIQPSCIANNGEIDITVNNGSGVYSYSWGLGIITEDRTGLGPGVYTVTVTDLTTLCVSDYTYILTQPEGPTVEAINTSYATCGNTDGTIDFVVSGGAIPYSYSINNGGSFQAGSSFTTLTNGSYDYIVEDITGCQVAGTIELESTDNVCCYDVTGVVTQPGCPSGNNGEIDITIGNPGTASYTYNWSNGASTEDLTSLSSTVYVLTVSDGSCEITENFILTSPSVPVIDSVVTTFTTCGNDDGSIIIYTTAPNTPISYSIDAGATTSSSNTFTNLENGTYDIVVEDNIGCQATTTETISLPASTCCFSISESIDNPDCFGETGSIDITVANGSGNYTYSWDNGSNSEDLTNEIGGSYTVTVTDTDDGCDLIETYTIVEPTELTISANGFDATCGDANGQVVSNASGGTPTYAYSINNGTTTQLSGTFSSVNGGNYTVSVTDNNGCDASTNVIVVEPSGPNASFTATPNNGTPPLDVDFDNTSTGTNLNYEWHILGDTVYTEDASDVFTDFGTYPVWLYVTDGNGCMDSTLVNIALNSSELEIPNIFTPNGDGDNDTFFATGFGIQTFDAIIYNRWGKIMKEYTDFDAGWDGTTKKGKVATDGVYFYVFEVTFVDGTKKDYSGSVQLMQ